MLFSERKSKIFISLSRLRQVHKNIFLLKRNVLFRFSVYTVKFNISQKHPFLEVEVSSWPFPYPSGRSTMKCLSCSQNALSKNLHDITDLFLDTLLICSYKLICATNTDHKKMFPVAPSPHPSRIRQIYDELYIIQAICTRICIWHNGTILGQLVGSNNDRQCNAASPYTNT